MPLRAIAGVMLAAVLMAACGGGGGSQPPASGAPASPGTSSSPSSGAGPSVIPYIVTLEQTVGPNRLLFTLLDPKTNAPVSSPDRPVSVAFTDPGGAKGPSTDATFLWAIEGERGVYVVEPTFPVAGDWKASFTTPGPGAVTETINVSFQVIDKGTTVPMGGKAPSVKTPTLTDVGGDVAKVSTDATPVPAFYEHSVDALLAAGTPFALVFATPKFCTSSICGPTLDKVKAVAAERPGFTFVNVEPYELDFVDGALQPKRDTDGHLIPVASANAYGLLTEPWVFVVDGTGTIVGSYETVFSEEELLAAIDRAL